MFQQYSLCVGFVVSMLVSASVLAQNQSVYIAAEVPVQFNVEYQFQFAKRFSVNASVGVLTKPNSDIIIDVLKAFGTDEQIVLIIDDAFNFGLVGELGFNYHFRKSYVGVFAQVIDLRAANTSTALIEDYFGTSISSYPSRRGNQSANPKYLTLKSTLFQGGLLYGRNFKLSEHYFLLAQIGVSVNMFSSSRLSTDTRDLTTLSEEVNNELAGYYHEYAFVPSLTFGVGYKFGRKL